MFRIDGEGYENCALMPPKETYSDCLWVEGVLLEDDLSMRIGGTGEHEGYYNVRAPRLDQNPVLYDVTSYAPSAVDGTPQERFRLTLTCVEEVSPLSGEVRPCPESTVEPEPAPRVGFELLEIVSPNEIRAWASNALTLEEFDAIELSAGWLKNQPRESDPDGGSFARSPTAAADGEFVEREIAGFMWTHVATVVETNIMLDPQGLLIGSRVEKFHEVSFDAGRTLDVIISPEGAQYVRITRDAGRTTEVPTIPGTWQRLEHETAEELVLRLPDETLVIRSDNQDSYQGPLPSLELGR